MFKYWATHTCCIYLYTVNPTTDTLTLTLNTTRLFYKIALLELN